MTYARIGLAAVLSAIACSATAMQTVDPVEGHNAFVKISSKETTRIVIEGAKIRSLIATDGELAVDKDEERGQLFIRPTVMNKPINARIISSSGATYNLVMQPIDIPQEDVVIREPFDKRGPKEGDRASKKGAAGSAAKTVKGLMSAMALDEPPNSVDMRPTQQELTLWEGTRFVMTAVYTERDLVGEKYRLTNTGKAPIRMVEQEFYRRGVVAIAIENMQVESGQSTYVYVIRSN